MSLHDDTREPRRSDSQADERVTAAIPAEAHDTSLGLPLLAVALPGADPLPAAPARQVRPHTLCLHKDPPLWRFGH